MTLQIPYLSLSLSSICSSRELTKHISSYLSLQSILISVFRNMDKSPDEICCSYEATRNVYIFMYFRSVKQRHCIHVSSKILIGQCNMLLLFFQERR